MKENIEKKLEIFLKEHKKSKERTERLSKIIETYATRYHQLTGEYYVKNELEGYYKWTMISRLILGGIIVAAIYGIVRTMMLETKNLDIN